MSSGYVGIGTRTSSPSSTSAFSAISIASERAGRDEYPVRRSGHATRRVIVRHRLPSCGNAVRRQIAVVAIHHRLPHRLNQVRRSFEPKCHRIADVQVTDSPALRFNRARLGDDVTDGVREDDRPGLQPGSAALPSMSAFTVHLTRQRPGLPFSRCSTRRPLNVDVKISRIIPFTQGISIRTGVTAAPL